MTLTPCIFTYFKSGKYQRDILMQISTLELLPSVASTTSGLDYMCTQSMLHWLMNSCSSDGDLLISGEVTSPSSDLIMEDGIISMCGRRCAHSEPC